jgi:hypothetical protein
MLRQYSILYINGPKPYYSRKVFKTDEKPCLKFTVSIYNILETIFGICNEINQNVINKFNPLIELVHISQGQLSMKTLPQA